MGRRASSPAGGLNRTEVYFPLFPSKVSSFSDAVFFFSFTAVAYRSEMRLSNLKPPVRLIMSVRMFQGLNLYETRSDSLAPNFVEPFLFSFILYHFKGLNQKLCAPLESFKRLRQTLICDVFILLVSSCMSLINKPR